MAGPLLDSNVIHHHQTPIQKSVQSTFVKRWKGRFASYEAGKSAAADWCYFGKMDQNLSETFLTLCWTYAMKIWGNSKVKNMAEPSVPIKVSCDSGVPVFLSDNRNTKKEFK